MSDWLYKELTGEIIGAHYTVFTTLGNRRYTCTEGDLAEALARESRRRGHQVRTQVPIQNRYQDRKLGGSYAVHLVVDDKVALLVKRVQRLTKTHKDKLRGQLLAGGWAVGLVLNYGAHARDYERCYEGTHDPTRREVLG